MGWGMRSWLSFVLFYQMNKVVNIFFSTKREKKKKKVLYICLMLDKPFLELNGYFCK